MIVNYPSSQVTDTVLYETACVVSTPDPRIIERGYFYSRRTTDTRAMF